MAIFRGALYDLETDPGETLNLFDDPGAAALRTRLMANIESRTDDMRPLQKQVGMAWSETIWET